MPQDGPVPVSVADTFVTDNLPPPDLWPAIDTTRPPLSDYPEDLNAAVALLDDMAASGHAERPVLHFGGAVWTYADLKDRADRIARVLVEDMGLKPGNRVLLRGPNNPMMVAAWFAVLKAGGVCVATMPLLRARELTYIVNKARITHALCDHRLAEELEQTRVSAPTLARVALFSPLGDGGAELDTAMAGKRAAFANVMAGRDAPALIAFTSGTTGQAKGTVHFHRDLLAICDLFPRQIVKVRPDDVFCGSPPLAFTFGLGALVLFPMRYGASSVLVEKPSPQALLEAIARHRATGLYTAPTAYRAMLDLVKQHDLSSLRVCVSAGEHLPHATWEAWRDATGLRIVDGIGATEMLHIFISRRDDDDRPGSTGQVLDGYEAAVMDGDGNPCPPGEEGHLAVRGPTGCRYLDAPERQAAYVRDGWNYTGDVFRRDADGYFWYVARGDDMIISAGYNISGPEVEGALLEHPKVQECAVVASPCPERGHVVKAFVVLHDPRDATPDTVAELQAFVKAHIAPYKYPRQVEFVDALPKTETGKIQRFRLRRMEEERAGG